MENWRKNILGYKGIYIVLIFTLLIAQTFKLHLHIGHDDTVSTNTDIHTIDIHTIDIHAVSYLHEVNHDADHHDDIQQHYNSDIDVGSATNNLVKKAQILDPFVFFILTLLVILLVPQLRQLRRWYDEKNPRAFSYYSPPQRAPPTL